MQININIPDEITTRVVDSLAFDYKPTIDGQPNPQTKAQFAKNKVIEFIKLQVRKNEELKAIETARATVNTSQNNIVIS